MMWASRAPTAWAQHKLPLTEGQDLAPDNAGCDRKSGEGDDRNEGPKPAAEKCDQQQRDQHPGDDLKHLREPHQAFVHGPPVVSGGYADGDPGHGRQERREHADE